MRNRLSGGGSLRRWVRVSWAVLTIGVLISVAIAWAWDRNVEEHEARSFETAAGGVTAALTAALSRNADSAASVAALARSMPGLTNRKFQDWYGAIDDERPEGSPAIGFIRYVPGPQLGSYLAGREGDIAVNGTTVAATQVIPPGARSGYCLVELGVWSVPELSFPPGLDFCAIQPKLLADAENRSATVSPATSKKSLAALSRMVGGAPPAVPSALRSAFFYSEPVFARDIVPANGDLHPGLLGWVGGIFDPSELVAGSIPAGAHVNVGLSHENKPGETVTVVPTGSRWPAAFDHQSTVDIDGKWIIDVTGAGGSGMPAQAQALIVGVIASLVNLLLFSLFRVLASAESKAVALAERRTAELRAANEDRAQLLKGTLEVAEREQSRLAAELHDGPIQKLTASGFVVDRALRRLKRNDYEAATTLIEQVRTELSEDTAALRTMMVELRPPMLDQAGLAAGLRSYAHAFAARTGIAIEFVDGLGDVEIPDNIEVALYRIGQQSLANIDRHAAATHVKVDLRRAGVSDIELLVSDNGCGFDTSTATALLRDGHYGLAGMRERVEVAGGRWLVESSAGVGTTIAARVPIGVMAEQAELLEPVG